MPYFFAHLDEKKTIYWKFSSENCLKCIILAYFSNKVTNYAFIFCAFGRETQIVGKFWENFEIFWWKFYRKIEFFIFILFFRKFVTKNRAFGNNTIFLQQFFRFRGGGNFPPFPPGYALASMHMSVARMLHCAKVTYGILRQLWIPQL